MKKYRGFFLNLSPVWLGGVYTFGDLRIYIFIASLIATIVLFICLFIYHFDFSYFIDSLITTLFFGLLMKMEQRITQNEQEIASLKDENKRLNKTSCFKENKNENEKY